MIEQNTLMAE